MGQRFDYIDAALEHIDKHHMIKVVKKSSYYETEPWGYKEQKAFINVCVEIETELSPMNLLKELQSIEKQLDRVRDVHWGPRTIDIDILLYDELDIDTSILKIPHPRMTEREFVLVPLKEINEQIMINNRLIDLYLDEIEKQGVKKIDNE